jgi:hypothetical protein
MVTKTAMGQQQTSKTEARQQDRNEAARQRNSHETATKLKSGTVKHNINQSSNRTEGSYSSNILKAPKKIFGFTPK